MIKFAEGDYSGLVWAINRKAVMTGDNIDPTKVAAIKKWMLDQFDSPFVRRALDEDQLEQAQAAFRRALDRTDGGLLEFFD